MHILPQSPDSTVPSASGTFYFPLSYVNANTTSGDSRRRSIIVVMARHEGSVSCHSLRSLINLRIWGKPLRRAEWELFRRLWDSEYRIFRPSARSFLCSGTDEADTLETKPRTVDTFRCPVTRPGRLAQLVRAPRLHRGGRGFESLSAHPAFAKRREAICRTPQNIEFCGVLSFGGFGCIRFVVLGGQRLFKDVDVLPFVRRGGSGSGSSSNCDHSRKVAVIPKNLANCGISC